MHGGEGVVKIVYRPATCGVSSSCKCASIPSAPSCYIDPASCCGSWNSKVFDYYSCCTRDGGVLLGYVMYRGSRSVTTSYMPASRVPI
jgi:hypothetical protein